jgi:hypothetical protein
VHGESSTTTQFAQCVFFLVDLPIRTFALTFGFASAADPEDEENEKKRSKVVPRHSRTPHWGGRIFGKRMGRRVSINLVLLVLCVVMFSVIFIQRRLKLAPPESTVAVQGDFQVHVQVKHTEAEQPSDWTLNLQEDHVEPVKHEDRIDGTSTRDEAMIGNVISNGETRIEPEEERPSKLLERVRLVTQESEATGVDMPKSKSSMAEETEPAEELSHPAVKFPLKEDAPEKNMKSTARGDDETDPTEDFSRPTVKFRMNGDEEGADPKSPGNDAPYPAAVDPSVGSQETQVQTGSSTAGVAPPSKLGDPIVQADSVAVDSDPSAAVDENDAGQDSQDEPPSRSAVVQDRKISVLTWCPKASRLQGPESSSGTTMPVETWLRSSLVKQVLIIFKDSGHSDASQKTSTNAVISEWQKRDARITPLNVSVVPDGDGPGVNDHQAHPAMLNAAATFVPDDFEMLLLPCTVKLSEDFFSKHPAGEGVFYHGAEWAGALESMEQSLYESNSSSVTAGGGTLASRNDTPANTGAYGQVLPCLREVLFFPKRAFSSVNGFDERIWMQGGWEIPDLIRRVTQNSGQPASRLVTSEYLQCEGPAAPTPSLPPAIFPPSNTGVNENPWSVLLHPEEPETQGWPSPMTNVHTFLYRSASLKTDVPWELYSEKAMVDATASSSIEGPVQLKIYAKSKDLLQELLQDRNDPTLKHATRNVLHLLGAPGTALVASTTLSYAVRSIASYKRGKQLVVHLQFGLCNRLRALASAMEAAKTSGRHLRVIWERDMHTAADFHDLFENQEMDVYNSFEASEYLSDFYDRYNYMEAEKGGKKGVLVRLESPRHIYVKSAFVLNYTFRASASSPYKSTIPDRWRIQAQLRSLVPNKAVRKLLAEVDKEAKAHLIGVHIRESDPRTEIPGLGEDAYDISAWRKLSYFRSLSSYENFAAGIKIRLDQEPHAKFFISADSPQIKTNLKLTFGSDKIFAIDAAEDRECMDRGARCLQQALADLLMLGKTRELYGSYWSSFTEVASYLNGI